MQLNRTIPFTDSWKYTFLIGLIMASVMVSVLIFLQPFDTYMHETPFKNLKLTGYGVCILMPLLVLHIGERWLYRRRGRKWVLTDEGISLMLGFLLFSLLSFWYNHAVVNGFKTDWGYFGEWAVDFAVPFMPIFLALWIYMRYRFGTIEIKAPPKVEPSNRQMLTLKGNNQGEELRLESDNFLMAHAQGNYVDVFFLGAESEVQKHTLRQTLSNLEAQIPISQQVHRSYLIHPRFILDLEGNARKGWVRLKHLPDPVPASPKHFQGLKSYLQSRPNPSDSSR